MKNQKEPDRSHWIQFQLVDAPNTRFKATVLIRLHKEKKKKKTYLT